MKPWRMAIASVSPRLRLIAMFALGVLAAAAIGIGGVAAASRGSSTTSSAAPALSQVGARIQQRLQRLQGRLSRLRADVQALGIAGPPVHQEMVVPSTSGGFETVTVDRGNLTSVSGNTLKIDEAVGGKSYRTVTLTVPGNASISRNFSSARLSDLKAGDRVSVAQSQKGARVVAWDAQHAPRFWRAGAPGP